MRFPPAQTSGKVFLGKWPVQAARSRGSLPKQASGKVLFGEVAGLIGATAPSR